MASNTQLPRENLSVTTAIIGLLAVGGKIIDALWDLEAPARKAKSVLAQVLQEVKQCRSTVHILYKTFSLVESGQLPFPERGSWIKADYLIATLTDTVLAVSDLQSTCDELNLDEKGLATPPSEGADNGGPPAHEKLVRALCSRLRWHNLSMTLMMTILKCPGESDAQNSRVGLERRMMRLLSANTTLADRLRHLDEFSGIQLPHYTPAIRHAQTGRKGAPATSTPAGLTAPTENTVTINPLGAELLSPFSRCTLADVRVLSIIPLPVYTSELVDGVEFYTFEFARRVSHDLSELMQNQAGQGTSRSLGVILGWTQTGIDSGGSASSTGSSNESSPVVIETEPDIQTKTKKWRVRSFKVRRRWRA